MRHNNQTWSGTTAFKILCRLDRVQIETRKIYRTSKNVENPNSWFCYKHRMLTLSSAFCCCSWRANFSIFSLWIASSRLATCKSKALEFNLLTGKGKEEQEKRKGSKERRRVKASSRTYVAALERGAQRKVSRQITNLFCKNILLALGGNLVSLNFCLQSSFLERIDICISKDVGLKPNANISCVLIAVDHNRELRNL